MPEIIDEKLEISKSMLLGWFESFMYVFHDIDINYYDEEAEELVGGVFDELSEFLKSQGIDLKKEMKARKVI